MYEYGKGVSRDINTAVMWYTKAAKQGHAPAQNNLGCLYKNGRIDQNFEEAIKWYTKAIQGDAISK